MPCITESKIKRFNWFCNKFKKGRWKSDKTDCVSREIFREDGSKLRIIVVTPKEKKENVPGLLWIHGGGYEFGVPEMDQKFMEKFIIESGCTIVSPDYRLSVESPYPAALEDCYLALKWLKENAEELSVRDDQIFVGGESAGGGLTAAVTLYARDKKEVSVAYQMPLYPMIDDRFKTKSSINNDAPLWNTKSNKIGWKLYLGDLFGSEDVPIYVAPARCTDYRNFPPTCTFVGTIETFHDETV